MADHDIGGSGQLSQVRFGAVAQLRDYWQGLCDSHGGPPPSSALDPAGLGSLIEDLFIAERIGRGLLRLRVVGRNLSTLAGVDMQGLPLSALLTPESRISFAAMVEKLFSEHQPVEARLRGAAGFGRQGVSARLLLLPLALPRLGPAVLLGCLAAEQPQARLPGLRFALEEPLVPATALPRAASPFAPSPLAAPHPETQPVLPGLRLVVDQPWIARAMPHRRARPLRLVVSREAI